MEALEFKVFTPKTFVFLLLTYYVTTVTTEAGSNGKLCPRLCLIH
jgi:hypothetical protein